MNDLHYSRWQSGEICQVLSTGAFTLFCHVDDGIMGAFFLLCHFCAPFCSRNCLLDVSRLLGLTLRLSAPVCSCHRDSLTRWRLALAQEVARVVSSASSRLFFCSSMCLVISDNLRGRSLQAMKTYESPASLVNLFFTHFLSLLHSQL